MKTRILTAGCKRFREPILLNTTQAEKHGYETSIYDLGDLNIEGSIKHTIDSVEFKNKGRYYRVPGIAYSAKALHKGDIVLDCLDNHPDDFIIYMDGDAIMLQTLDEMPDLLDGCDIGLTLRDAFDMRRCLSKQGEVRNFLGTFNSGVMVFNNTNKAKEFAKKWFDKIEESQSDQKALNMLVNPELKEYKVGDFIELDGVKIKCLNGEIYNWGYWPEAPQEHVKVIHAKGLRFRGTMDRLHSLCRGEPELPLRGYERDFEGFVDDIPWEPHSISNVEAYYWWALVAKYKPDVVLESGICKGRSTHFIAEACDFYDIPYHICIEKSREHEEYVREKFSDYNMQMHYGQNSDVTVENLSKKINKYRTLLIVDGPKDYKQSMKLYKNCNLLNIVAIGVHDCSPAGGCQKALSDARQKYWPRASMIVTDRKTNGKLYDFNESIKHELNQAFLNTKEHWSKKIEREMTLKDYEEFMSMVGIVEIEGK